MRERDPNWTEQSDGAWRDELTGLTWLPREERTGINHHEAMAMQTAEKRLPTLDEWRLAWEHGIKEQFKDWKCEDGYRLWFWSSTPYASNEQYAWLFNSRRGSVDYYNRSYSISLAVARCVRVGAAPSMTVDSRLPHSEPKFEASEVTAYLDKKIARLEKELRILKELRCGR